MFYIGLSLPTTSPHLQSLNRLYSVHSRSSCNRTSTVRRFLDMSLSSTYVLFRIYSIRLPSPGANVGIPHCWCPGCLPRSFTLSAHSRKLAAERQRAWSGEASEGIFSVRRSAIGCNGAVHGRPGDCTATSNTIQTQRLLGIWPLTGRGTTYTNVSTCRFLWLTLPSLMMLQGQSERLPSGYADHAVDAIANKQDRHLCLSFCLLSLLRFCDS